MRQDYTPFLDKKIEEISADNLSILSTVHEGWYVEYKRNIPNQSDIAKAISAFANTYGGWLFFGVEEKDKIHTVAQSCPGISEDQVNTSIERIRQSVNSYLNPCPYFECKVVWGPNQEMQLARHSAVICVYAPLCPLAPILHSNGLIYRRVSDSSEPKPETDRHLLDQLWRRSDRINDEYKAWIASKPELSAEESDQAYIRLLLDADKFGATGARWSLSINEVKDALNSSQRRRLPIQSVYRSGGEIIARQTSTLSRHKDIGLTWVISDGLKAEVWIPLNVYDVFEPNDLRKFLSSRQYKSLDNFIKICEAQKMRQGRVVDLTDTFKIISAAMEQYLSLLSANGSDIKSFSAKLIIDSILKVSPFFNSDLILAQCEENGIPLSLKKTAVVPKGNDAYSFQEIVISDDHERSLTCAVWVFELICRAFGFVGLIPENGEVDPKHFIEKFSQIAVPIVR